MTASAQHQEELALTFDPWLTYQRAKADGPEVFVADLQHPVQSGHLIRNTAQSLTAHCCWVKGRLLGSGDPLTSLSSLSS